MSGSKGKILASFAVLGGTILLWFIPMIRMSGGWSSYRSALRELWVFHPGGHSFYDSGWASLKVFSFALLSHLVHGLGAGVFPLVLSFYSLIRRGNSRLLDRKKVMFFSLKTPLSYPWIKHHDRELSLLLKDIRTFDPGETAIFVNNYIYYSYRHVMVYLSQYRVYNVDVRESSSGERRKTFWGIHGKTYLAEEITLPAEFRRFVSPPGTRGGEERGEKSFLERGIWLTENSPH